MSQNVPPAVPPDPTPEQRDPAAPTLTNFATIMPGPQRLAMRHPGELPWLVIGIALTLANYVGVVVLIVLIATGTPVTEGDTSGVLDQLILLALLLPLIIFVSRATMYAQLRVNSVRMSPTQFPQGYRMVCEAAYEAGLRRVPDAYVVLGNGQINAFAAGHGFRRFVAVYSDLFEIGGEARDPDALRFIIGHEVGHIAAGHVSYFRLVFTTALNQIPPLRGFLSRAQEYTADNYGYRYCAPGASGAMATLAAGKYLNVNVDTNEFADRATQERSLWTWLVNLMQSHPVLTWRTQALRDRSKPGALFWPPKFVPSGIPSLPSGSAPTRDWPDPYESLVFLQTYPPAGPPQFGANFPVPRPGTGYSVPGQTDYGYRELYHGWMQGGPVPPGTVVPGWATPGTPPAGPYPGDGPGSGPADEAPGPDGAGGEFPRR
ncbi:Zn-dependent protease with chaperone function [Naumannella cuiyingiana]|uniref:Zn-dependent protease with chaperone function n=1 Tax=Naumannella cuiyingiana TaxID=1347891 RepID=A0A7Z0ILT7_9ACTN|nr:Zn-dependent protease with chaperone function [Naumannella cuiyingiana]